ncbi:MAG: mechanosensitive ion channel domain-containing protein [Woeseia sp.]
MTKARAFARRLDRRNSLLCIFPTLLILFGHTAIAQEEEIFDPIGVGAELDQLVSQLEDEEIGTEFLAAARARVVEVDAAAEACQVEATEERARLEARFEPLKEVDADVTPTVMDQRNEIRQLLDDTIALQTQCTGVRDYAVSLLERIANKQTELSQQYLSSRGRSVISLLRDMPSRLKSWPTRLRDTVDLKLTEGMTPVYLLWLLIIAGSAAAALGLLIRHRFNRWFVSAGGPDAEAQMRFLFPKPMAQYSPLLLEGLALIAVFMLTVVDASLDLTVVRIAVGILLYGIACVVIDWATGPLSPSAQIKGLIPDHVGPLRLRLRFFALALVASFVVLGTRWLTIRMVDPDVSGRATMIFIVAVSLFYLIAYLGRIPGLQGRFRLIRYLAFIAVVAGVGALILGYQNLAGYLIHGVTRTALALFMLWILLWLVTMAFEYVTSTDTPGASRLRANLGVTERASRTGMGFMQLIADLVLWLSFAVYLIYVWDESGTTLDRLFEIVEMGGTVGAIRLVPLDIIRAILAFALFMVLIGWIKGWIDRRWLQHIVLERGARDALITLFGYVGFIIAVIIGLGVAEVDLRGIAIVSGALALGIGFGMQEIANNFVSGLILLFERPIRAGDFVTVGEVEGFVRSIRIRATEIETLDNQNVLVPNSELVSGRVTNWVLRDTYGRLRILVGVAYGSDVEKVREILETVARAHPEVITDGRAPEPRALFMGFGDSSLDFELRIRINRIERRFQVTSDINFAVDQAFRDAKVTIPFPQRDLHLVSYPDTREEPARVRAEPVKTKAAPQPESVTRSHRAELDVSASIEDVWTALTDIDYLKRWLALDGEFTPQIGRPFSLSLRDGSEMSGRIDVFMPPRRMRMVIAPREGEDPLSSGPITVDFLLRSLDEKSHLTIGVAGIPASEDWEEYYRLSEDRWQNALVELKHVLHRE